MWRRRATMSFKGDEVVLLVEDEEAVRMLARALLERNGYTVIEASDAEAAMRLADEHDGRIDLLLTDVVMPGRSGPELFAALKPARPEICKCFTCPVIPTKPSSNAAC